jgi:hypothetical protein
MPRRGKRVGSGRLSAPAALIVLLSLLQDFSNEERKTMSLTLQEAPLRYASVAGRFRSEQRRRPSPFGQRGPSSQEQPLWNKAQDMGKKRKHN